MKVVVVALGKIGLPLAVHIGARRPQVVGCDVDADRLRARQRAPGAVPGRGGPGGGAGGGRRRRPAARARPTRPRPSAAGPTSSIAVPPLIVDAARQPDWRSSTASSPTSPPGCRAGTTVSIETTRPGRHDARADRAGARAAAASSGAGLLHRLQPRARLQRPRLQPTSTPTRSWSAASRRPARRAASSCTAASSAATPRCGRWARPRRPS